jgi:WD40 repeat protein/serine/threonine protein kinase
MNPPKPNEAAVFNAARQIAAPEARRQYIEETCGEDGNLRARVEALLRVHAEDRCFLEAPAVPTRATPLVVSEGPGTQIGLYKLVEQIGEGGFGVVFMAEQQLPIRRIVAVKILKPGMDTRQVVARFEAERQALALMDHPNIARVLDGGATASGRPYFVMELVKGVPITRYCDEQQLTLRERLSLFIAVCAAVQHAHQKGIIHRDLKPTNVLVAACDGKPVPKLIDFGVARALGQRLTERTLVTGFGSIVGTLEYMSPEQAEFNALDVDTRADIYSLGVLLYELLTGTTPLTHERLKRAAITEALRLIREEEPPKPSSRLSESKESLASISVQRKLEPARLTREVRGELDWIVMKAVEKDRGRRYATANGLARDLERYLNDEPVEACPPSALYKLRKLARKNRALLSAAAAFALLLAASTAVSTWLAAWATLAESTASQERDRAEAEAKQARRHLYAADMNLAQSAWAETRLGRLEGLLEAHRPKKRGEDLRGFEWYYWHRLTNTARLSLTGHGNWIWCVAVSPDGSQLATASADRSIKLWDAAGGRELQTLTGHTGMVSSVAFGPDGQRLASASMDGTLKLWDLASGQCIRTFVGHTNWVVSVAFSPDGTRLASASHDRTAKVWDCADGRTLANFKEHTASVQVVAFSPDGKWIASGSHDTNAKIWDAATGDLIAELAGHTGAVQAVAFSPDGKRLVSGSADKTVKVWDLGSGKKARTLTGHTEPVYGVAFCPDGKRVASASVDQTVRVWDADSGKETLNLKGHAGWVSSVAFSPDATWLVSASADRTVKVWDAVMGQEPMTVTGASARLYSVAFSPDGTRLATASRDEIEIWDSASGLPTLSLRGHTGAVRSATFSPDRKVLASAGEDGSVRIWDATSGREIRQLKAATMEILRVAFSPNGKRLAAAGKDKTVRVWDVSTGAEALTLHGHTGLIHGVAFSPDGNRLASAGADNVVKVWDAGDGRPILTIKGHTDWIECIQFSPDGRTIASGGGDKTVRVWDTATGRHLLTLDGHNAWVASIAFSPDGKRLASTGGDRTVKVWDLANGQETLSLRGHTELGSGVAFSPDGDRLASVSYDANLRVWDARPWTPELRVAQEAQSLIRFLHGKLGLRAAVIQCIEHDASQRAEVRQVAVDMMARWTENPRWLNRRSWKAVAQHNAAPESCALALRQAREACRLEPNKPAYINTLGVALYRCGRYQESLDTLQRSDRVYSASSEGRQPSDVAFLAMAQFKLTRQDQAQTLLGELRLLMKQPAWSRHTEGQGFLREAMQLIEGKR